jgi:hypothetical protein
LREGPRGYGAHFAAFKVEYGPFDRRRADVEAEADHDWFGPLRGVAAILFCRVVVG